MAAGKLHLNADGSPHTSLALQRQADINEVSKTVTKCVTVRALQGALQLPCEHITHSAVAPAACVTPRLQSLCPH